MLGNLGLQVASRFARTLRETGARCQIVALLPATDSSRAIVAALREWSVTPSYYSTSAPTYSALKGNRAKLIRYWAALEFLQAH